jgi:hypothetical protein
MMPYISPKFGLDAFNCPMCNVYSDQTWKSSKNVLNRNIPTRVDELLDTVSFCTCRHCSGFSIWVNEKMVYPRINGVPFPHPDTPKEVKEIYEGQNCCFSVAKKLGRVAEASHREIGIPYPWERKR